MTYSAKSIANAFLNRASRDKKTISPMKLQKLVYYAHGYHLGAYDIPLIDEYFEAWPYGPVVPGLYHEFKEFGSGTITRLATEISWDDEDEQVVSAPISDPKADRVIDFVWKQYGEVSAVGLSEMTHRPGTPWEETQDENKFGIKNKDIDNEKLKAFFAKLVKKKQQ